jgi:predicted alpha/beta-fold hydrolase
MLEQPEGGGHAGFLSAPFPGRLDWLPLRLVQFFETAQKHLEAHVVSATR